MQLKEYRMSTESKSSGCIACIVYGCALSVLLLIAIGLTLSGIEKWFGELSKTMSLILNIVSAILFLAIIYGCFRYYRKRTTFFITIDSTTLKIGNYKQSQEFKYTDIKSMSFHLNKTKKHSRITLKLHNGILYKIHSIKDIQHLWNDLISETGHAILSRCTTEIEQNKAVSFSEDHKWRLAVGLLAFCATVFVLLGIAKLLDGSNAVNTVNIIKLITFAIAAIRLSMEYLFMRNSGIILSKDGIKRSAKNSIVFPWKEIASVEKSDIGITLHTQNNHKFKISTRAENFFLFAHFLQNFIPSQCFNKDTVFPARIQIDDSNFRILLDLTKIYDRWSWEFSTQGLAKYNHREIDFILRMEITETSDNVPSEIIDMIKWLYKSIANEEQVIARNISVFPTKGFLGREDWMGLTYSTHKDNLCAILLTENEYNNALLYGSQRILNRLGELYRHYPTIDWNDRDRTEVAYKDEEPMMRSTVRFLDGTTTALFKDDKELYLKFTTSMPTKGLPELLEIESSEPKTFSINTHTVPEADYALMWYPGQEGLFGIAAHGAEKKKVTGCFVVFIPYAKEGEEGIGLLEDGFVIFTSTNNYIKIISAMAKQQNYEWQDDKGKKLFIEWKNE
ncbi:hypothetical protein [Candidatus Uabimicrobium sp. HlEnr_7]|uniref:hypothetical protein n=1 Tax=Candidatus Uabimicrobium helgolandensis TaxID=3095367 RepID=UPI003558098E